MRWKLILLVILITSCSRSVVVEKTVEPEGFYTKEFYVPVDGTKVHFEVQEFHPSIYHVKTSSGKDTTDNIVTKEVYDKYNLGQKW